MEGIILISSTAVSDASLSRIFSVSLVVAGLVLVALTLALNPTIIESYISSYKKLSGEMVRVLLYWGNTLILLGCFVSLVGLTLFIFESYLSIGLMSLLINNFSFTERKVILIGFFAFLVFDIGGNFLDVFGSISDLYHNDVLPVLQDPNLASAIYNRMRLAYTSNGSIDALFSLVSLYFLILLIFILYLLNPSRYLLRSTQLSKTQLFFVVLAMAFIFASIAFVYNSYSQHINFSITTRSFALFSLLMAPWTYILHKLKFDRAIIYSYLLLVTIYVVFNLNLFLGLEFSCHDTKQGYHVPFLLLADALTSGGGIGWNSFSWGGEPLYIYSNFFLWAEAVLIIYLNKILSLPPDNLFNIFFLYYIASYATMCLLFFIAIFKDKLTAVILFSALLFGGLTLTNLGQFQLAGVYFIPIIALSFYLSLKRKEWLYVGWAAFFMGVSVNHYLPGYTLGFIIAFGLAYTFVVFILKRRLVCHRLNVRKKYLWWLVICLLCLCVVSTALYLFVEINQGYVSPTRGYASLEDKAIVSPQRGVFLGLDKYLHLIYQPMTSGPLLSGDDIQYYATWHSPHYVGSFILLFAILSFFRNHSPFKLIWLFATGLIIIVAAGDNTPIWYFATTHLPAFNLRHSFFFGSAISFLIITLAGYGIKSYIENRSAKIVIALAIIITGILFGSIHGLTTDTPPESVKAFSYPENRTLYNKIHWEIPLCFTPYFAREAVVTHRPEEFIFMIKKEYLDAISQIEHVLQGPMFFLSTDQQLDSVLVETPFLGVKHYAEENKM